MAVYKIFENGKEINRIVGDEDFMRQYCEENGYTYEYEPPAPAPAPVPTQLERVEAQALYTAALTGTLLDEETEE